MQENNTIQNVMRQQLTVDPEKGPHFTIQEAIDRAEPNAVIKIVPGLYNQNIVINKPGLSLENKEKVGDIIIVSSQMATLTIDLKKEERCFLIGLKMSHTGSHEEIDETYENPRDEDENGAEEAFLSKVPYSRQMNCVINVASGKLFMEDCLVALNFIVKGYKAMICAVVIGPDAEAFISRCELKGTSAKNQDPKTIGILVKQGDLVLKDSKIHNHTYGGILIDSTSKQTIRILSSKITQNKKVGIHCVGPESVPVIEQNRIENNDGPGIKVSIGNSAKIILNEIKYNHYGIDSISADPFIFNNRIDKNYNDGILMRIYDEIKGDGKIKTNQSISGNKENGIKIIGVNNYARVEGNTFIGYNKKAGIRVEDSAQVVILKNMIQKNLSQGILLVQSSSAIIEKNQILDNIKANIALGGENSVNTVIVANKIKGGRCEGIFMIDCSQCLIIRNSIKENNDGIICVTSIPEIRLNKIKKNKSNGIMIMKDSQPIIIENMIQKNDGIGIFVRDKSHGNIKQNTINCNSIELVVERRLPQLEFIKNDNTVDGDIRIPQNYDCRIF